MIFWKIKFKVNFELGLTLFLILEYMLLLSFLTIRTQWPCHGHCCSTQSEMESINMLLRSESKVKARRLILSCQNLIMTKISAASHVLTAYKGVPYGKNFKIDIGRHAVVQFFCCAGQWYISIYFYKVHKIKTKINLE